MDALQTFVRQVSSRSSEHRRAMVVLEQEGLAGQMVAVLRQELDSMVRVIYLLHQDEERRAILLENSINGERWSRPGSRCVVTDKEMVDQAQTLQGWTRSVYKMGCAFIHLSCLHDYNDRDPLTLISSEERDDILDHCNYYHGGPDGNNITFSELVPYLPRVLVKIADNLRSYLDALEHGGLCDAS